MPSTVGNWKVFSQSSQVKIFDLLFIKDDYLTKKVIIIFLEAPVNYFSMHAKTNT